MRKRYIPTDLNERRQLAVLLRYLHEKHGYPWYTLAQMLGYRKTSDLRGVRSLRLAKDEQ